MRSSSWAYLPSIPYLEFKLYYKIAEIKTAWYQNKRRLWKLWNIVDSMYNMLGSRVRELLRVKVETCPWWDKQKMPPPAPHPTVNYKLSETAPGDGCVNRSPVQGNVKPHLFFFFLLCLGCSGNSPQDVSSLSPMVCLFSGSLLWYTRSTLMTINQLSLRRSSQRCECLLQLHILTLPQKAAR